MYNGPFQAYCIKQERNSITGKEFYKYVASIPILVTLILLTFV